MRVGGEDRKDREHARKVDEAQPCYHHQNWVVITLASVEQHGVDTKNMPKIKTDCFLVHTVSNEAPV